ncbi:MAG: GNAT family N-acetyltransferase [Rhodobacter sp.]|nr:GNAT family N-acetyltransferase [Rhodobacter sp.]
MTRIRRYRSADAGALAEIFFRAVHEGARTKYTEEERQAWAPTRPSPEDWARRLDGLITFVAFESGSLVGFMSLRSDGYLDLAFVLPEWMGKGVADALLRCLESEARRCGIGLLTTEASHLARSFFLRHG